MCEKLGTPWEYCPRNTLRRLIGLLDKEFGLVCQFTYRLSSLVMAMDAGKGGFWNLFLDLHCCLKLSTLVEADGWVRDR